MSSSTEGGRPVLLLIWEQSATKLAHLNSKEQVLWTMLSGEEMSSWESLWHGQLLNWMIAKCSAFFGQAQKAKNWAPTKHSAHAHHKNRKYLKTKTAAIEVHLLAIHLDRTVHFRIYAYSVKSCWQAFSLRYRPLVSLTLSCPQTKGDTADGMHLVVTNGMNALHQHLSFLSPKHVLLFIHTYFA